MIAPRSNLASLVDDFRRHGSQIAVVAPRGLRRRRVTYSELAILSRRFAAELAARGVAKGDRVLLWGENGPEWMAAFFGCVLRGVLPVPVDIASNEEFVRRVSQEVAPKLIVGDAAKLDFLGLSSPSISFETFDERVTAETAETIPDLTAADALQIVFTSGTTGDPKGVVHTHNNVLASLRPIETEMQKYLKYERIFHPIRFLHTLPLSHVFGQFMGLWIPALLAAEVHYESRLVAPEIVERIRNERISVLAAVPRVLDLLQQYVSSQFPDLPARVEAAKGIKAWKRWWRFRDLHRKFGFKFWAFVCGGASLPSAAEQFWNNLGFLVVQGYGMTETTALVSLNHPFKAASGTIGQVLPGREVRLSDEGEVLVRGETISNTVWQNGQLRQQDSDWLATGDLAEFDDNGNLRFRGRKKDVIVTSAGLNIYPEDLEAALKKQAGVKDCTVVETAADHGPEPFAALVLTPGTEEASVIAGANRTLADFQQIRRWVVWPDPELPHTSTGKVLRREVAKRIHNGDLGANQGGAISGDLNLDSLGRVELQARLEQQYGITLDDTALQQVKTNEDVHALMASRPAGSPSSEAKSQHIYPHWPWNPVQRVIRSAFLELVAMPLVRFLAKPACSSNVTEWPSKPLLIVANHVTSYDVPFILCALPGHIRRNVAVAMSGEMILDWRRARNQGNWFLNLVAPIEYFLVTGLFNVFPLPQFSGFQRSFRHAGEAVDRGFSVIVFPEGHRSPDGSRQPFMKGAGLLWKELGTAAAAVRLEGLGEIKARGSSWFRTGKINVTLRQLLPAEPAKSPEELTRLLEQAVFGD